LNPIVWSLVRVTTQIPGSDPPAPASPPSSPEEPAVSTTAGEAAESSAPDSAPVLGASASSAGNGTAASSPQDAAALRILSLSIESETCAGGTTENAAVQSADANLRSSSGRRIADVPRPPSASALNAGAALVHATSTQASQPGLAADASGSTGHNKMDAPSSASGATPPPTRVWTPARAPVTASDPRSFAAAEPARSSDGMGNLRPTVGPGNPQPSLETDLSPGQTAEVPRLGSAATVDPAPPAASVSSLDKTGPAELIQSSLPKTSTVDGGPAPSTATPGLYRLNLQRIPGRLRRAAKGRARSLCAAARSCRRHGRTHSRCRER